MPRTVLRPFPDSLHVVRSGLLTAVVRDERGRTVVVLQGEADVSTTSVPSDALSWVIAWRDGDVVVDLGELAFIDSATVRVLANGDVLLASAGRRMTLRSPSAMARRVLHVFGLSALIEAGVPTA